jgi:hypothetical protein
MVHLWPFYIEVWWWQRVFCDDLKMYYVRIPTRWWHTTSNESKQPIMTKKQGYLWPNLIITEQETPLTTPLRHLADGRLWRTWCFIHDQMRSSQIETTSMTTHQSSQNSDTSMTKICILSLMDKCDATIMMKHKSSQIAVCDQNGVFNDEW